MGTIEGRSPSFFQSLPRCQFAPFVEQHFSLKRQTKLIQVEQWVEAVTAFSTEYQSGNWRAAEVIGGPKVYPNYGDLQGAWAPGRFNNMEFLEVRFAKQVSITRIDIYETNLPGYVTKVQARVGSEWVTLYEGPTNPAAPVARIFSPTLSTTVLSNILRIEVNCLELNSWPEIDCIKLVGQEVIEKDPPPKGSLASDFQKLFLDPDRIFGDVTFVVEGREIKAHRCILWSRSDVFKAMLTNNMAESTSSRVIVTDFTFSVFSQLLEFVYTGYVNIKEENVLGLYCAADKYNFPQLREICLEELYYSLTAENVPLVYATVSQMESISNPLVEVCLRYIKQNIKVVVQSKNFEALPRDLVVEVLKCLI